MSLTFIKENYSMPEWSEDGFSSTNLGVGGYMESFHRFIYDSNKDEFVLCTILNTEGDTSYWLYNLYFDGETGDYKRYVKAPVTAWQLLEFYFMKWGTGSFGNVYSSRGAGFIMPDAVLQMDIDSRLALVQLTSDFSSWDPSVTGTGHISFCVERKEAIVEESGWLSVYDCTNPSIPVKVRSIAKPGTLQSLSYENSELFWTVTTEGIIGKLNFVNMIWEVLTALPDISGDTIGIRIAYDTLRKRLCIFRVRADGESSNNSSIEFYSPLYLPTQITDPVPVNKIVGGQKVKFVAHLLGTVGEGLVGYKIIPSLTTGEKGRLITNFARTRANGSFLIEYLCDNSKYVDTLELSAEVPDSV